MNINKQQADVILSLIRSNQGPQYYELCEQAGVDPHELTTSLQERIDNTYEVEMSGLCSVTLKSGEKISLDNIDDVTYEEGFVICHAGDKFLSVPVGEVKFVFKS